MKLLAEDEKGSNAHSAEFGQMCVLVFGCGLYIFYRIWYNYTDDPTILRGAVL